jgi:hypothetical protein
MGWDEVQWDGMGCNEMDEIDRMVGVVRVRVKFMVRY